MGRLGFRGRPASKVSLLSLPEKSRFVVAEESRPGSPRGGFWQSLWGGLPQGTGWGTPSELGFLHRACAPLPAELPDAAPGRRSGKAWVLTSGSSELRSAALLWGKQRSGGGSRVT